MLTPLTTTFLASIFESARNLIWIQDTIPRDASKLVADTCKANNIALREIKLDQAYPIDLEEMFNTLPSSGGVFCIREADSAHSYLNELLDAVFIYYKFRRSSMSKHIRIPKSWKFVLITKPEHRVNKALYRKFIKLVNVKQKEYEY